MLGRIDAIGVDEIQFAKGHKYLTLVYQIDLDVTRLLWVGRERTIEFFRVLKNSRWLLLRREENLKTDQRFRLRDLLSYDLKTVRAHLLKEAFQQLWDYNSPAWAGKFLDDWCRQVMRSRIEPMNKIARSVRQHRGLILNDFRAQKLLSSGVVEGLNNKAKLTMRKSYGFRTFRCLELALYHSLGKLPEPKSTHDFF